MKRFKLLVESKRFSKAFHLYKNSSINGFKNKPPSSSRNIIIIRYHWFQYIHTRLE